MEAVMTVEQARAQFRARVAWCDDERAFLIKGNEQAAFWAVNQGTDDALDILTDLKVAYERILTNIDQYQRRRQQWKDLSD